MRRSPFTPFRPPPRMGSPWSPMPAGPPIYPPTGSPYFTTSPPPNMIRSAFHSSPQQQVRYGSPFPAMNNSSYTPHFNQSAPIHSSPYGYTSPSSVNNTSSFAGGTINSSAYHTSSVVETSDGSHLDDYFTTGSPSVLSTPTRSFTTGSPAQGTPSNRRYGKHDRFEHNRGDWVTRAIEDPWEEIVPLQTPRDGCLVSQPLAHTHTVLFAPRSERRKTEDESDDHIVGPSDAKRRQVVDANTSS